MEIKWPINLRLNDGYKLHSIIIYVAVAPIVCQLSAQVQYPDEHLAPVATTINRRLPHRHSRIDRTFIATYNNVQ